MSSSDPSDRKSYTPATSMTHSQMPPIPSDPQAGLHTLPPHFPQQPDPYRSFVPFHPHQPPPPPVSPGNSRKRPYSDTQTDPSNMPGSTTSASATFHQDPKYYGGPPGGGGGSGGGHGPPPGGGPGPSGSGVELPPPSAPKPPKRSRTNTPWTPGEEQRLKTMREAGNSWSEIAKTFPQRTEGSVKKHWYKDMHYAEFAEDESASLLAAIKDYEANKWKVIGQKVGKPAKACEQYAKEHFGVKS